MPNDGGDNDMRRIRNVCVEDIEFVWNVERDSNGR